MSLVATVLPDIHTDSILVLGKGLCQSIVAAKLYPVGLIGLCPLGTVFQHQNDHNGGDIALTAVVDGKLTNSGRAGAALAQIQVQVCSFSGRSAKGEVSRQIVINEITQRFPVGSAIGPPGKFGIATCSCSIAAASANHSTGQVDLLLFRRRTNRLGGSLRGLFGGSGSGLLGGSGSGLLGGSGLSALALILPQLEVIHITPSIRCNLYSISHIGLIKGHIQGILRICTKAGSECTDFFEFAAISLLDADGHIVGQSSVTAVMKQGETVNRGCLGQSNNNSRTSKEGSLVAIDQPVVVGAGVSIAAGCQAVQIQNGLQVACGSLEQSNFVEVALIIGCNLIDQNTDSIGLNCVESEGLSQIVCEGICIDGNNSFPVGIAHNLNVKLCCSVGSVLANDLNAAEIDEIINHHSKGNQAICRCAPGVTSLAKPAIGYASAVLAVHEGVLVITGTIFVVAEEGLYSGGRDDLVCSALQNCAGRCSRSGGLGINCADDRNQADYQRQSQEDTDKLGEFLHVKTSLRIFKGNPLNEFGLHSKK